MPLDGSLNITIEEEGEWYSLTFTGTAFREFLDFLKTEIHSTRRRYDPIDKVWRVRCSPRSMFHLCDSIENEFLYAEIEWDGRDDAGQASRSSHSNLQPDVKQAFQLLYVTENAPLFVTSAAYKALAKQYHPDSGHGNEEVMRQLNLAYEKAKAFYEQG